MTPEEFLDQLPEARRSEVAQLDAVIRAAVPELARTVQGAMPPRRPRRERLEALPSVGLPSAMR